MTDELIAAKAPRKRRSAEERFWAKVDKTEGGCWEWRGARTDKNYGTFSVDYRTRPAHRFAYELLVGPIPEGLQLDHLCRNRGCVNPAHLEPVTSRENSLRGISPTAVNATKTHCVNGHEFTPENTQLLEGQPDHFGPMRRCAECNRASTARYYWKKKNERVS